MFGFRGCEIKVPAVTIARKSRREILVWRNRDSAMQSLGNCRGTMLIFAFSQNRVKDRATDQCHDENRMTLWLSDTWVTLIPDPVEIRTGSVAFITKHLHWYLG